MSSGVESGSSANINAYQTHRLREAVSGLGVMSPQTYLSVVSTAQQNFLERMSKLASEQHDESLAVSSAQIDDMPQLQAPEGHDVSSPRVGSAGGARGSSAKAGVTGGAMLTELVGELMDAIGEDGVQRLKEQADIWNKLSKATQDNLNELSKEFEQATAGAQQANDDAKTAQDDANKAAADAKAADGAVDIAQKALDDAKAQKLPDGQIKQRQDDLDAAQQTAADKHQKADSLKAVADKKLDDATTKTKAATDCEAKANDAAKQAAQRYGGASQLQPQTSIAQSGAAALTLILGELQGLISKSNVDSLEAKQKLFNEMQQKREAELQKKSDEYQEQVRKADEMQKTMGCIGKIVGWLVTAVSFAAAAFTGGASLALAAVGLALAVGDEICKAATGVSFMDKIMQPIMDTILKPLMSLISSLITKALVACGVDKQAAELAGAILGAVVTGVALVAAAFAGASLVKAVASKVMTAVEGQLTKLMESSIGKMVTEMVENFTEKSGVEALGSRTATAMTRMRKAIGVETKEDGKLLANRLDKTSLVLNTGNQITQAAGGVVVGVARKKAADLLADIKEGMSDIKFLGELLKQAVDTFAQQNRVLASLMQDMSDASEMETSTCTTILRNARAV
ncbi:type III secretion system translocon subunit SctE [Burkholderia pyrrocinia]